jgi:hypothetical protein
MLACAPQIFMLASAAGRIHDVIHRGQGGPQPKDDVVYGVEVCVAGQEDQVVYPVCRGRYWNKVV